MFGYAISAPRFATLQAAAILRIVFVAACNVIYSQNLTRHFA
jgi:hypothetical protein